MRTSIKALAVAMLFAAGASPALAEDETAPPGDLTISGYVQGVSDYRFRGYSLSGGDPALQGTINLNHSSGFYAGAWASSLDANVSPFYGDVELDLYAGWTGLLSSALTADVGVLRYVYPSNDGNGPADYWEPYASLSTTLGPVSAKLGVAYAPEQDSLLDEDNLYVFTDLSAGIPNTPISLSGHLGYADGIQGPRLLTGDSLTDDSGFDYSVGATYAVTDKLSVSATYVGVDGSASEGDYRAGRSLVVANDTVVATIKLAL
ncbi:MAG TPA: TorF family putative porin [Novosphingobium sp.]|nr:TorF family putative porin [Novosphingobium sp.]